MQRSLRSEKPRASIEDAYSRLPFPCTKMRWCTKSQAACTYWSGASAAGWSRGRRAAAPRRHAPTRLSQHHPTLRHHSPAHARGYLTD